MDLGISGLASGFDWRTFIDQMIQVEQQPETKLRTSQNTLNQRNNAYGSIKTELGVLSNRIDDLKNASFFDTRTAQTSDSTLATATASNGAALGQYDFEVTTTATASAQLGTADLGAALSATADVSGVILSSAPFAHAVTAGTFTVNGHQVTVATTDTLQQVFDKVSTATGSAVTAAYDPTSDKITLSCASPIILGSATDTSNFLQVAKLNNNGTGSITSTDALGTVRLTTALAGANLATPTTDDPAGAGEFKINGVAIDFNANTDSLSDVIGRINNSTAGVTASYDTINDRLVLTSKATGDMGIALEDTTGQFLAATGLLGGTLKRGTDLVYTVNGGGELRSHSNTITEDNSGLTGLSVTVLKAGSVSISVGSDTSTIKKAITDFVEEFNKVESMIDTQTASTTDANGKVTAGLLANDGDADAIARQLRSIANAVLSGLTGGVKSLDDLGIGANGSDNTLKLEDSTKLDAALANNLGGVKSLFTDSINGLATKFSAFLEHTIGDDGTLVTKQNNLTHEASDIDTQIADMERRIQDDRQRMIDEFTAMEKAEAKINQQMTYLMQALGGSSAASSSSSSSSK
jgi:flagellar hook-associated protein 2